MFSANGGNVTVTQNPPPGELSNLILPPSCSTRSHMPRMPYEVDAAVCPSGRPRPLSLIDSIISSSQHWNSTSTLDAPECRPTLVRVSWNIRNSAIEYCLPSLPLPSMPLTWHLMPV